MTKNEFINYFIEEDKSLILKIYDKIVLAEKSGSCIFSNEFYPPNIWGKLKDISLNFSLNSESFGGFNESERRLIAFYSYDLADFPIKIMKITNGSKFSKLEHKDYLGALMSLGVKREKLGDLIVKEDSCYVAVYEDISEFMKSNLTQIGRSPCSIDEVTDLNDVPGPTFKSETIVSTSYRLDCITSALTSLSRSKCISIIDSGKVLVNYVSETRKDRLVTENDTITIRGYGKFKVLETTGTSGSGRLKINVNKYV